MTHLKYFTVFGIFLFVRFTSTQECGPNEIVVACPASCESDYCPKYAGQPQECPRPASCPPPACKCIFDYRRDDNGTCIPTKDCPPFKCSGQYEVYTPCPSVCSEDCAQATIDAECPMVYGFIGIVVPCTPQCRCKPQHWRKDGQCVFFTECIPKFS